MSCPCTDEFANVYLTLNDLTGNFNAITGNVLTNFNQLTRSVAQQGTIYNAVYYGLGNITAGNANIIGSTVSSTGFVPVCRAAISFQYISSLTVLYSNNCTISRNSVGSYTVTFTNPPGSTDYTVSFSACSSGATTITQAWQDSGRVPTVGLKSSTQCLIWISDNNSDNARDPYLCDVCFFW